MFVATGPVLASKTVSAINAALEKDQGNLYRKYLKELIPHAADAYRQDEEDGFRSHLGASMIGKECARQLWYNFHWTTNVKHPGRIVRLFNRGHLEEPRFVALLKMIGCQVWQHDEAGNQFRVAFHEGHFGGSLDSVAVGIPDSPEQPVLCEFKTHGDKSFSKLQKEGMRSAKLEHYVQMQIYMGGYKLAMGLYLAVNKNDDDLYGEMIPFDQETFDRYVERGGMIINTPEPPPKINSSPGWFTCKFCDFKVQCHSNGVPHRNCRTCISSQPGNGGSWSCVRDNHILSKSDQLAGCPNYRWNPKI
jgi:hypothetical protein